MFRIYLIFFIVCYLWLPVGISAAENERWFAGMWDSSIYNRSEKPRTVALRVEIMDAETGIAVSGAKIQLKGGWLEERIGTAGDEVGIPYEPQERDFGMLATSGTDGVVIFALSWEKEYPWRFGRPEPKIDERGNVTFYDVHTSWKRAVDDIEKIREIEVNHPDYKSVRVPLNFSHLTEFGQDKRSEGQETRVFAEFENAWHQEMKKQNVRFCVLDLSNRFNDFGNMRCMRPEFFEKIKQMDFGTVYRQPSNWFSVGEYPQSECGPYFVYLLCFDLEPRSSVVDIRLRGDAEEGKRRFVRQADERRQANLRADEAAWEIVSSLGTEEALKKYISEYPRGRYVTDARQRLEAIESEARAHAEEGERRRTEEEARRRESRSSEAWRKPEKSLDHSASDATRDVASSANGGKASASSHGSYMGSIKLPSNVNDGRLDTQWAGTSIPAWVMVTFDRAYTINRVRCVASYHTQRYEIQLSRDGRTWTTVETRQTPFDKPRGQDGGNDDHSISISEQRARHIRVLVMHTDALGSHVFQAIISELQAFGF